MEPHRNFPLKKGTLLSCISYRNTPINPLLNIYFTSQTEAIMSLFRNNHGFKFELSIPQPQLSEEFLNNNDELYLNTFYVTEDIIIHPPRSSSSTFSKLLHGTTIDDLRDAITSDCIDEETDGFVVPYTCSVIRESSNWEIVGESIEFIGRLPLLVEGRISAYVICHENLLIPVESFKLISQNIFYAVDDIIITWYKSIHKKSNVEFYVDADRKQISIAIILENLVTYINNDYRKYLKRVHVKPFSHGYASLPSITASASKGGLLSLLIPLTPETSPLASPKTPIVSPLQPFTPVNLSPSTPEKQPNLPSSMLSPKDPSLPVFSPGGTTTIDVFSSVPTDVLRLIALNMKLDDLLKACSTSTKFLENICDNEDFWKEKLRREFVGTIDNENELLAKKPEEMSWKQFYREISGLVEQENALDYVKLTIQQREAIRELPILAQRAIINNYRKQAGFGELALRPKSIARIKKSLVFREEPEETNRQIGNLLQQGAIYYGQQTQEAPNPLTFNLLPANIPVHLVFNSLRNIETRYKDGSIDKDPNLPVLFEAIIENAHRNRKDYGKEFSDVMEAAQQIAGEHVINQPNINILKGLFDKYVVSRNPFSSGSISAAIGGIKQAPFSLNAPIQPVLQFPPPGFKMEDPGEVVTLGLQGPIRYLRDFESIINASQMARRESLYQIEKEVFDELIQTAKDSGITPEEEFTQRTETIQNNDETRNVLTLGDANWLLNRLLQYIRDSEE